MSQEYFEGRAAARLTAPFDGTSKVFAADHLDGQAIHGARFAHCTFANISFKEALIEDADFENCVFLGCYFRKSQLKQTIFRACKFIDCGFPSVVLADCTFRFPSFRGCFIEFERIESSLPAAPNERYLMTVNLETQARQAGDTNEARLFRLESLGAWEDHLLAAVKGNGKYYQEHYPTTRQRARQLWRYIRSKVNGWAWGYGERGWVLMRNFLLTVLGLFPGIFFLAQNQFHIEATPPREAHGGEFILMSLANVLPGTWAPNITDASVLVQIVRTSESFLGILMAGMLVSLLIKAVSRR